MDKTVDIHLLFPKVVAEAKIGLSQYEKAELSKVYEETTFVPTRPFDVETHGTNVIEMSDTITILDRVPFLKQKVIDTFYDFKNNLLRYEKTDFKLTTSWFTKTRKGQVNGYHKHANQFYSCVYYFDNPHPVEITFEDFNPGHHWEVTPIEWNPLNRGDWSFHVKNDNMLMFPSEVYHRIQPFKGEGVRKSIAINFTPTGEFGFGDSLVVHN